MENSQSYRAIGRGKVIEHKKLGSNDIEVIPFDEQPHQQGALVADIETTTATGTDARGATYSSTMSTSKAITATWKGNGDNRVTAPDVRRGEWVELYVYHDTQKVYWQAVSGDHGKRRKEKVTHRFSMTDDENTGELDDDNSISVDHDGENGMTTIKVPSVGGKAPVTFQMNSKQGTACMLVGEGNFVQIEQEGDVITSQNAAGSYAIIEGDDIRTNCAKKKTYTTGTTQWTNEGEYKLDTGSLSVNSAGVISYVAASGVNITSMTTMTLAATAGVTISAPSIGLNGSGSATMSAGSIDMVSKGNLSLGSTGALSLTSASSMSLAAPSMSFSSQSGVSFSGASTGMSSDDLTEIKSDELVEIEAPKVDMKSDAINVASTGDVDISGGNGVNISGDDIKIKGDSAAITGEQVNVTGVSGTTVSANDVKIEGQSTVSIQSTLFSILADDIEISDTALKKLAELLSPLITPPTTPP